MMRGNLVLVVLLMLGACAGDASAQVIRVGFAYPSPRDDLSWTYTIENARQTIAQDFPDVFTEWGVISVPASQTCPDACLADLREFAARGFDLVVLAGHAFLGVDAIVADEYYSTLFIQISSAPLVSNENIAWVSAFIEQVRFLSGVTAGLMTTTNEVGYVTVNRLQPTLRQFNAWYFGVRKVNPNAKVYLISGNAYGNPIADRIAAEYILNVSNVDVLSYESSYAEVSRVACENGIYSTGYGSDIRAVVGDSVLTSAMWNWVPALEFFLDEIIADDWDNTTYDGTLASGSVELADFSPVVPQNVTNIVLAYMQQIIDGTELMFCGPQVNYLSDGAVPVDSCMTRAQESTVYQVPSSTIDPNFIDLGNVDLSLPASVPLLGCWTPVVIGNPPDKACLSNVAYSQSLQNSYVSNGVTYSQWAVSVTSANPLHGSLEFSFTPESGSIWSVWGAVPTGDGGYSLDDWRFSSGISVPGGSFFYIVSSDSPAAISTINATCTADCTTIVQLSLRSSWPSDTTYDQLYEISFVNVGVAVTGSVDITINFPNGTYPIGIWNIVTASSTDQIKAAGKAVFTATIGFLAVGQSFPTYSGFILSTPLTNTPQTPTFSVESFSCL